MFPPQRTSTARQRAIGALQLIRSFLLLEDDYDVDWEVDQDERFEAGHPHRATLGRRAEPRRAGAPAVPVHVCLSPVNRPGRSHERRPVRWEGRRGAAPTTRGER